MDLLFNPNKFFYDLVAIFANMVDMVVMICNQLCGIPDEHGNNMLMNMLDVNKPGGQAVAGIFLGLVGLAAIFGLCAAMMESAKTRAEEGVQVWDPYEDYAKGIGWMLGVWALFAIVVSIIGQMGAMIYSGTGGDISLGKTALQSCFTTFGAKEAALRAWNDAWSNPVIPTWSELQEASGEIAGTFNAWPGLIGVGVIAFPLIGVAVYLMKRITNILMLYAVAPISFGLYPTDAGHAKDEWLKDIKGSLLGGIIVMIALQIFLQISKGFNDIQFASGNELMNAIFHSLMIGMGASAILTITKTVLKFFGLDDQLLTSIGAVTPSRAFGAIKRGMSSVKGRIDERRGKSGKNAVSGGLTYAENLAAIDRVGMMRKRAQEERMSTAVKKHAADQEHSTSGIAPAAKPYRAKLTSQPMAAATSKAKKEYVRASGKLPGKVSSIQPKPVQSEKMLERRENAGGRELVPGKIELKLKDGNLTKAINKLSNQLDKIKKKEAKPKDNAKTKNRQASDIKPKQLKKSAKTLKPVPINIAKKYVLKKEEKNVTNLQAAEPHGSTEEIKKEISRNRQQLTKIEGSQIRNNKRTQQLQRNIGKLSKKK